MFVWLIYFTHSLTNVVISYSSAVSAIYTPYVPPTAAAYVTPNGVIIQQAQANQHPNQHIIDYNGGYLAQLQAPQAQYAADVAAATGNGELNINFIGLANCILFVKYLKGPTLLIQLHMQVPLTLLLIFITTLQILLELLQV